jgi:hypothetical protein
MTKTIKEVIYGVGGFDETKPNNNIVETVYFSDEEIAESELQKRNEEKRNELLSRLGITQDEAKLLLG